MKIEGGDPDTIGEALVMMRDGAAMGFVKVIMWRGQPWLVPYWLEGTDKPVSMPARVIPLVGLQHQFFEKALTTPRPHNWVVNEPLPNALFGPTIPPQLAAEYRVVEAPPIGFRIPTDQN